MWGTLPLPWRNSNQYEILKRAVEVLADSDKPWRLDSVLDNVPDDAGVSSWEKRKLARFVMKKVKQKKEEIYNYELAKFALGESNDLGAAKKNAESLGMYAYERAEEEKMKAQQAQVKYPPIPNSILQQYTNQLQIAQMKKMQELHEQETIKNKFEMYKNMGQSRYQMGMSPEQYLDAKQNYSK